MLGKHSKGLPTMARQRTNSAMLKSFDVMLKVLDIWFVCLCLDSMFSALKYSEWFWVKDLIFILEYYGGLIED